MKHKEGEKKANEWGGYRKYIDTRHIFYIFIYYIYNTYIKIYYYIIIMYIITGDFQNIHDRKLEK